MPKHPTPPMVSTQAKKITRHSKALSVMDILRLASRNAEYAHFAICPSCHSCMALVYAGSSGQEFWCPGDGCNVGFKYDLNGDFDRVVLCPAEWVGEDA